MFKQFNLIIEVQTKIIHNGSQKTYYFGQSVSQEFFFC